MNEKKSIWETCLDLFGKFTMKFDKIEDKIKTKTGHRIPVGNIVGGLILVVCIYLFLKVVLGIIGHKLFTGEY